MKRGSEKPASPSSKQRRISSPKGGTISDDKKRWTAHYHDSTYVFGNRAPAAKIAAFDLDGTIIKPASGRTFPKDKNDWTWWDPVVPQKLRQLVSSPGSSPGAPASEGGGFRLAFFTNQGGISRGKEKIENFQEKIASILEKAGLSAQDVLVVVATGENRYRKPSTAGWEEFVAGGASSKALPVNLAESFYCGDAAGRAERPGRKKDFSDSDFKFALNLGVRFETPESFFLNQKKDLDLIPLEFEFDPRKLAVAEKLEEEEVDEFLEELLGGKEANFVMLVGPPGAGKSTVGKLIAERRGHKYVNQDTLGNKEKCLAACRSALLKNESVVLDNQNRDKATRAEYLKMVKALGNFGGSVKKCRAVHFDLPKGFAMHMNQCRARLKEKVVPEPVIHAYFKHGQGPEDAEGFDAGVGKYGMENFRWIGEVGEEKRKIMSRFIR